MSDYYKRAIDAAIRDMNKPLADLTEEEQKTLASDVYAYLIAWGVFRVVDGKLRGGPRLLEANRLYGGLMR